MTSTPFVISIQSQVVFGHVGNSAAVFPMLAVGLEVAAIPTVIFSNTPDYPPLRGRALPWSTCPIVRPSIPSRIMHHQIPGPSI
jgi:hypothetical protein